MFVVVVAVSVATGNADIEKSNILGPKVPIDNNTVWKENLAYWFISSILVLWFEGGKGFWQQDVHSCWPFFVGVVKKILEADFEQE